MSVPGPLYTCCTVHVSTQTVVHINTWAAVYLLFRACQQHGQMYNCCTVHVSNTGSFTLVALCMSAHGPLYTCCTVHVSTRTAVHINTWTVVDLLLCACQHTDSCTLVAPCMSVHGPLYTYCPVHVSTRTPVHSSLMCSSCTSSYPPFRPYITWLQRINLGRIFIKSYINVPNNTFLRKGESRQKLAHRQSLVTSSHQQTSTRNLHIFSTDLSITCYSGYQLQYH
jgi:hypothetical protein